MRFKERMKEKAGQSEEGREIQIEGKNILLDKIALKSQKTCFIVHSLCTNFAKFFFAAFLFSLIFPFIFRTFLSRFFFVPPLKLTFE